MLDDKNSYDKLAQSFLYIKDRARRLFVSGLIIILISFATLAFPYTGMRLGEMSNALYRIVIEYNKTLGTEFDLYSSIILRRIGAFSGNLPKK